MDCSQNFSATPLVTLDLPDALAPRVLNALKAEARSVELRSLAPHFYALATRMLELFDDDEMLDVLSEVGGHRLSFLARAQVLIGSIRVSSGVPPVSRTRHTIREAL
jgi:hypothetical protein